MNRIFKLIACRLLAALLTVSLAHAELKPSEGSAKSQDGTEIRYQVMGEGEPTLVFVHCWCCDSTYWREQLPVFAPKHRVVAIDLAGHGQSALTRTDYTIENYARDVEAVASNLDLKNIILLGHSMGGPVSVLAAGLMPQRVIALIAVDTLNNVEEKFPQDQIDGFLAMFRANFKTTTENFIRNMMFHPDANPELVNRIANDMASAPAEVGVSSMQSIFNLNLPAAMDKLKIPIFLINGDKFPLNEEAGKRHASFFKARIIPKTGHFLQLEKPAEFNQALEETIREIMELKK